MQLRIIVRQETGQITAACIYRPDSTLTLTSQPPFNDQSKERNTVELVISLGTFFFVFSESSPVHNCDVTVKLGLGLWV